MGGLARRIPTTWITFMAGGLALSGIFPFAGFCRRTRSWARTFQAGVYIIWVVGIVAAFITAFLYLPHDLRDLLGQGDPLGCHHLRAHPREPSLR